MILYPAIDLQNGKCVRLAQGEHRRATIFHDDPPAQARQFAAQGFAFLHLVDLDGARHGRSVNHAAIEAIVQEGALPVQLGGGLRSLEAVAHWLGKGVRRVILGTAAATDPQFLEAACRAFPQRICVALDVRKGELATDGWERQSRLPALAVAKRAAACGAAALIHTDIQRDGMARGINVEASQALAHAVDCPVIASGGLAGLEDIAAVCAARPRLAGVICGRALYDGRLDARAALALAREATEDTAKDTDKESPPPC